MMITTKGRYALRVMIDLAENQTDGFIPLRDIAKRQEISEKYLETILSVLTKNKYLKGVRGKGGGYRLSREPAHYTIGNILKVLESSIAPVACLEDGKAPCARVAVCKTLPMWEKLYRIIDDYLEGITLADLCKDKEEIIAQFN